MKYIVKKILYQPKQWKRIGPVVIKIQQRKNFTVKRTKQNSLMLVSNCTVCSKKKFRFDKNQEASRLEIH